MSADRIRVTVDGEPVTREVSWDDVRAYLRAKGWELEDERDGLQMWIQGPHTIWMEGREVRRVLNAIARHESRHPAAVLRDIARGTETAGVEPLTEDDVAWIESITSADDAESMLRRAIATVRAREAERDEYARRLSDEKDEHIKSLRIANDVADRLTAERDAALKDAAEVRSAWSRWNA